MKFETGVFPDPSFRGAGQWCCFLKGAKEEEREGDLITFMASLLPSYFPLLISAASSPLSGQYLFCFLFLCTFPLLYTVVPSPILLLLFFHRGDYVFCPLPPPPPVAPTDLPSLRLCCPTWPGTNFLLPKRTCGGGRVSKVGKRKEKDRRQSRGEEKLHSSHCFARTNIKSSLSFFLTSSFNAGSRFLLPWRGALFHSNAL